MKRAGVDRDPGHAPPLWKVPRLWNRETCYMLGGGASLKLVDVSRLNGSRVVAVNNAYMLGQWDALFFGDCRWYEWHHKGLADFKGLKVTTCTQHRDKPGILAINKKGGRDAGLSADPRTLAWNLNSGSCAINLATLLGASRVILLGYDMRKRLLCHKCALPYDDGEPCWHCGKVGKGACPHCGSTSAHPHSNWHFDHRSGAKPNHDPYGRFLKPFLAISKSAAEQKIEIINATPGSALTRFPIVHPDTVMP